MPSIRTLKIFLCVARSGTFAAAGNKVGLTAAAIGLQIRALEDDLNVQLFDRNARAAVLNPVGRALIPEIEEIVRRYEFVKASSGGGEMAGTVVVGALVSALMGAFADSLWSIRQQYPGLDVHLFAGMSSDFARKVEVGELDAAVVTQPPRPFASTLLWTPLYSEPMVLIMPASPHFDLPDEQDDILRRAPFMRFDRNTWTGDLVQNVLDQCKTTVNEAMELNSVEAIVALVRQGFGISIVPQLANVDFANDRALRVQSLEGVDIRRHVGLLERVKHNRMAFTEAIKQYFASPGTPVRI
jgi:DNA-binding transcriptional LysR family regulator